MPILMVHDSPGGTHEQYEEVERRLTGGKGFNEPGSWPVEGLVSHAAGPTDDGWMVVDVWESDEGFHRFGEVIGPVLQELGYAGEPRIAQVHNIVK